MKIAAFAIAVLAAFAPASALTLEEALLDQLIAKGAPEDGAVALVGRVPSGLDPDTLDLAKIDYSAETGRFVVQVRLSSGRLYGMQGKVEDGMDVPVLTRALKTGEIVASDDVMFVRMAASRVPRGTVGDAEKLVGFSAKRQLRAGLPLRESDVQKPLVVRKGDAVTMVFRAQDAAYRDSILPAGAKRVAIEAASPMGWHEWVGEGGALIAMHGFGASAPYKTLLEKFGFTGANVAKVAKSLL